MNEIGYSKKLIGRTIVKDAEDNDVEGTLYLVDFHLPGDNKDPEQKYFIADGEDVDTVLSNAFYEKHLSIIQRPVSLEEDPIVIQKPKTFSTLSKSENLSSLSKEDADFLKKGTLPDLQPLDGGLVN